MPSPFWDSYHNLIFHIVPGPNSLSYFAPFILLPTALCIPPSILSKWQLYSIFLPLIYAFQIHAWLCIGGLDVISVNVAQWSFVLLVCYDPRRTFSRLRIPKKPVESSQKAGDKGLEGYWEQKYPETLSGRVPWVLTLLVSLRLSNWRIGDPSHDRTQPVRAMSRKAFCKYAAFLALQSFVILDITSSFVRQDPYFHISGISIDDPLPATLTSTSIYIELLQILPPRIPRAAILASQAYACITQGGSLPTIPVVGLNALGLWPDEWSPQTWPIFFGQFSAVVDKGLRGLWGIWWHQTNRYTTSTPGRALSRSLRISTNSLLGYFLLTTSAFLLSGTMHMGLIPPQPSSTNMSADEMRLFIAAFFWLQIPAFAFEILVLKACKRFFSPALRSSSLARMLTLSWVLAWMAYALPFLAVPFRELGYWKYPPLPISVLGAISSRGVWNWR